MRTHECSGCRQRRILVLHLRGLGYCEWCKEKAPSKQQFDDFLTSRDRKSHFGCHKHKPRFRSARSYDKE